MSDDDDDDDEFVEDESAPSFHPPAWNGKTMQQLLSNTSARGMPVSNSDELTRIVNLPRRPVVSEGSATAQALVEMMMQRFSLGPRACDCAKIDKRVANGKRKCFKTLKWEQAWALFEMGAYGGLIASCPVGLGKTGIDVMGALAIKDCKLALLMIPSNLRSQIINDYKLIAEHMRVPNFKVHLPGRKTWSNTIVQYRADGTIAPTVHVVPYQFISDKKNSAWIENLRPDSIMCDEVDGLSSIESSRTIRMLRYFQEHWATTRFFGWTGSLTNNSVSEFAHLLAMALRHRSPLPTDKIVIDEFSRCLDAVPNPCPPGALTRLLEPNEGVHEIRKAFQRRLAETAGTIIIGGRQIIRTDAGEEVVNDIREKVVENIPPRVLKALELARAKLRPDSLVSDDPDEILVDPLEQARVVRQVATGVFYRWRWDDTPRELALKWLAARKAWHSELRWKMLQGEVHLDSAKLCEEAARRAYGELPSSPELPNWRAETWPAWRDIKDACNPKTEAKWIDEWLAHDAADWAMTNGGIVWYGMREFGSKIGELTGLEVFGEGTGARLAEMMERGEITDEKSVIMSIKAHGRGTNGLQYIYDTQSIVNTMASARWFQQVLGRTCRDGQQSSAVSTEIYLHTSELRSTFQQALTCGEYVQDITTEDQMLIRGWRGYSHSLRDYR